MEGPRQWSVAAAEREIALTLARQADPGTLRPGAPWEEGVPPGFRPCAA